MANKVGRPSKYPMIDLAKVESLAALGLIDNEIALALGIAERTLNCYKKKAEFMQSIKRGKQNADLNVVKRLYEKATKDGDTTAMIFWLKNRQPDRWRDKHDVGISGEVKLIISNNFLPQKGK